MTGVVAVTCLSTRAERVPIRRVLVGDTGPTLVWRIAGTDQALEARRVGDGLTGRIISAGATHPGGEIADVPQRMAVAVGVGGTLYALVTYTPVTEDVVAGIAEAKAVLAPTVCAVTVRAHIAFGVGEVVGSTIILVDACVTSPIGEALHIGRAFVIGAACSTGQSIAVTDGLLQDAAPVCTHRKARVACCTGTGDAVRRIGIDAATRRVDTVPTVVVRVTLEAGEVYALTSVIIIGSTVRIRDAFDTVLCVTESPGTGTCRACPAAALARLTLAIVRLWILAAVGGLAGDDVLIVELDVTPDVAVEAAVVVRQNDPVDGDAIDSLLSVLVHDREAGGDALEATADFTVVTVLMRVRRVDERVTFLAGAFHAVRRAFAYTQLPLETLVILSRVGVVVRLDAIPAGAAFANREELIAAAMTDRRAAPA